ncbi:MAG: response regulator [Geoalkalibacter sp.]|uniref:response regulator n=1 Tax=Geoalkalibacter sp. TaxID=3041440 RepID=UPI003D0FE3C4
MSKTIDDKNVLRNGNESTRRGAFLAGMSHEIRTPLNSLLSMLQLLDQGELDPEQHEAVHIALDSGRCLLEIVNDIMDLARIEMGEITLNEEPFDAAEILRSVSGLYLPVAEDKEIDLRIDAQTASHLCLGDAARLRQIFFNLLGHALRHTDNGRIQATLSQRPTGEGTMQLDLLVSVSSPESARESTAFSPTPCTPTNRAFQETGLGLPIAQRLIELMGGKITLKVVDTNESEARVVLPCGQGVPLTCEESLEEEISPLQILLVEDDKVNQLATRRLLSRSGHKVVSTGNGEEALTALEQIRFDLILMDGAMPHLDGLETTRRIRASKRPYAGIPIIALTAHALQGDRERFLEAGMDGYLAKPLEFGEFNKTVVRIMRKNDQMN